MANLYDSANKCWPSSSAEPDDISLFLHQFLLRSSSSSFPATRQHINVVGLGNQEPAIAPGLCSGFKSPAGGCFWASSVVNVSSNDPDEYDCESEETIEALVEEAATNPTQTRNSSKRSRAAEVHNLSEKRRRSRINEKMKALQNLIPNSNKTDKASMLDEAIEYLKQLQLQVQMLTMRNGINVYPICLPGMLQHDQIPSMKMDCYDESRSFTVTKELSIDQETTIEAILGLQDNWAKRGICQEELMPCKNLGEDWCPSTLAEGYCVQVKGNTLIPFDAPPSSMKENTLESCFTGDILGRDMHLSNLLNNQTFPQLFGSRPSTENSKPESNEF